IEVDPARIAKRMETGYLDAQAPTLDAALAMVDAARAERHALSVGLGGNAADIYPAIFSRGIVPDIVTDQTSAHDLVYGYVPAGLSLDQVRALRSTDPQRLMAESTRSIIKHLTAMLAFQKAGA